MEPLKVTIRFATVMLTALGAFSPHLSWSNDRSTELNFEESVVEGVNKSPLDSLNQISQKDRRDDTHLYMKRENFRDLNKQAIKEQRFNP